MEPHDDEQGWQESGGRRRRKAAATVFASAAATSGGHATEQLGGDGGAVTQPSERERPEHYHVMSSFRVRRCRKHEQGTCEKSDTSCFDAHNSSLLRRSPYRNDGDLLPTVYLGNRCKDFPNCARGSGCWYAHNDLEIQYHPVRYKTVQCLHSESTRTGVCERNGPFCPFAHGDKDLRKPRPGMAFDNSSSLTFRPTADALNGSTSFGTYAPPGEHTARRPPPFNFDTYKVLPCHRAKCNCDGYHSPADRRRPPLLFNYSSIPCPHISSVRSSGDSSAARKVVYADPSGCPDGDECGYAHSSDEQMYHPDKYKSVKCSRETTGCQFGSRCSYLHSADEPFDRAAFYRRRSETARATFEADDTKHDHLSDQQADDLHSTDGDPSVTANLIEDDFNFHATSDVGTLADATWPSLAMARSYGGNDPIVDGRSIGNNHSAADSSGLKTPVTTKIEPPPDPPSATLTHAKSLATDGVSLSALDDNFSLLVRQFADFQGSEDNATDHTLNGRPQAPMWPLSGKGNSASFVGDVPPAVRPPGRPPGPLGRGRGQPISASSSPAAPGAASMLSWVSTATGSGTLGTLSGTLPGSPGGSLAQLGLGSAGTNATAAMMSTTADVAVGPKQLGGLDQLLETFAAGITSSADPSTPPTSQTEMDQLRTQLEASQRLAIEWQRAALSFEQRVKCPVCLTNQRNYAFIPCGHTSCQECARGLYSPSYAYRDEAFHNTCPICHLPTKSGQRIYL